MDDHLEKRPMPFLLCLLVSLLCTLTPAQAQHFPAPDPPREERPDLPPDVGQTRRAQTSAADIEWTLHKTPDGQHPNGDEQALMWLMNRARQNPAAEGVWLATSQEHDIADGRTFFHVDLQLLQNEFASYTPKPPAAFDVRLYNAARVHSADLIAGDTQDHNQQFSRVDAAGFRYTSARGSVFSFAESALNGHAAFNIDWGNDSGGVQSGRGHRVAIMSLDGDYTNVGAAAVPENNAPTQVGPLVITINYAHAQATQTDHFNRFVVGTVWEDRNTNGRYDPGEGIVVMPDKGKYFAITSAGGGYAIPITTPDTYELTFFGGSVALVSQRVVVGQDSMLLDYLVTAQLLSGDVNKDGNITPADALLAFKHFLGLTNLDATQRALADTNRDGRITPADARCIFQKFLSLQSCLN